MRTGNIHDAKTHLSPLVEKVAKSEPLVIARAGKPLVNVAPIDAQPADAPRRLGFLAGQFTVPDDVDTMGREEIGGLFEGGA